MVVKQKLIAQFTDEERECLSKLASIDCQNIDDVFCDDCLFDLNGRCVKTEMCIICDKNNIEFT